MSEGTLFDNKKTHEVRAVGTAAGDVEDQELDYLADVVAGTASASKALVLGTNKNVDVLAVADGGLKLGSGAGTAIDATAAEINRNCDTSARLIAAGSALTVTQALHDGKTIKLDTAAGSTCTLPAATGTGAMYRFVVSVLATSNSHIVKVANGTDIMQGIILSRADDADATRAWGTGATDDTITLNRTTTGSVLRGEWIEVLDVASGLFLVRGVTASSGTEATPFSATV